MAGPNLKVVPLDPDCKPQVGSLYERIRDVIDDACEQRQTTFAEAVGILDLIKLDMHREFHENG